MSSVSSSPFAVPGGFGLCIPPLLDALGWRGNDVHLAEAMPHLSESLDLSDLLNVMANLKFGSRSMAVRLNNIDDRTLPCLFVDSDGNAMVLTKSDGLNFLAYIRESESYQALKPDTRMGTAFFFDQVDTRGHSLHRKQENWFRNVLERFSKTFQHGLLISFLLSVLTLIMPLFIMTIYDQMPFFDNNTKLAYIVVGVMVFIFSDFGLRIIRSGMMSFIGARLGNIVGNEVFRRILYLPPSYTESASIGSQASRIKDFDSVRDFFSGQAFTSLLEMPFIVLLLFMMWVLGGPVVFVPLTAIVFFAILAVIYMPLVKRANAGVAKVGAARQEIVMEILTKVRAIKLTSTPRIWEKRYRQLSAECAAQSYRSSQLASQINVLTNTMIMAAGVSTMAVSVNGVIAGEMTMGALVASMILVWRILAPLRSAFVVMLQVERINKSVKQVDRLMNLDIEQHSESLLMLNRKMRGDIKFSQVSIRYTSDAHPALLGVNFSVNHGEFLAITGHDGAGKSTILKLIMGLYRPQAGMITINNTSLRQMDPLLLRRTIGYTPQVPQFFYGTIAQNLRLTHPTASNEELRKACEIVGVLKDIESLPNGFETRMGDYRMKQMHTVFLKKLNLCRSLVRPAPILLLDEVLERPSSEEGLFFIDMIKSMKGKTSVIAVTNHCEYLQAADKILWLEKGKVKLFGPRDGVLPSLPDEYKSCLF
ncbi:ATP-binding cassette, subfamily C [Maridesulfovibrio ferrireducens]|uniref:ATP-binding cassette, subfamily C n=1 Tax=Maridesulfovibrio ferrireducens TaxID=246191 RepID=A0A1G9IDA5_9BACT|nr:ABC transporter transmembrane domain-containing protein [Maridesulfovibrio ferrireducens]SDL23096.1 ATP-binding cassette, subfamily C [Maridesulfovibrio ferrireducens]